MAKRGAKKKGADITKEMFLEKLVEYDGVCYQTYTNLGLPYSTYYQWRKSDADFDAKIKEIQNKTTDFVESKMMDAIKRGDTKMIKFYLSTIGGYAEKKKVEISSGDTIDINAAIESIKSDLSE